MTWWLIALSVGQVVTFALILLFAVGAGRDLDRAELDIRNLRYTVDDLRDTIRKRDAERTR